MELPPELKLIAVFSHKSGSNAATYRNNSTKHTHTESMSTHTASLRHGHIDTQTVSIFSFPYYSAIWSCTKQTG